jgi:hypothetical protein
VLEHEIKYLVPASHAAALVAWTSSVCLRDGKYPPATVHTVYYDTPRLVLLGEKIGSDFLKTKVRVRWYAGRDGLPGDALFAEASSASAASAARSAIDFPYRPPKPPAGHFHDPAWISGSSRCAPTPRTCPCARAGSRRATSGTAFSRQHMQGARSTKASGSTGSTPAGSMAAFLACFPCGVRIQGRLPDPPAALLPVTRFARAALLEISGLLQHLTRMTL